MIRTIPGLVALALASMTAAVGGALVLQHAFGYMPCAMCLWGRVPHYVGIPLAIGMLAAHRAGRPRIVRIMAWALFAVACAGVSLSLWHGGVERGMLPGPTGCSGGAFDISDDLLSAIDGIRPPSCTEAALRVVGLSLAEWNAIVLALVACLAGLSGHGLARSIPARDPPDAPGRGR